MSTRLVPLAFPVLRRLDPETAHRIAIHGLRILCPKGAMPATDPILATRVFGLNFPNPIGLAAGFDKDALLAGRLGALGFGFSEAGTVTPQPQPGNSRPRLFRLAEDRALINRMGFNSKGLAAYQRQLAACRDRRCPIGVNIGINKDGAEPTRDYPAMVRALSPLADYIVINVSSPNTPGLRELQDEARLASVLAAVAAVASAGPDETPVLVKLAPDLGDKALSGILEVCLQNRVAGIVISNTTLARPAGLRSLLSRETGGLSGGPLFARSTAMLARAYLLARGRLAFIGVGGVFTGADALHKIKAGASLVQIYSAFVLEGPAVVGRITSELAALLRAEGFRHLSEAVGVGASDLAKAG